MGASWVAGAVAHEQATMADMKRIGKAVFRIES
jgi:hypothetical protein